MFLKLRILKKLNFSKKKIFFLYQRNMTILRNTLIFKKIFITNSLTWVGYNNYIFKKSYKYGSFVFTRKPFAKPAKRVSKKKR